MVAVPEQLCNTHSFHQGVCFGPSGYQASAKLALIYPVHCACRAAAETVIDKFVSSNTAVAFGNGELVRPWKGIP